MFATLGGRKEVTMLKVIGIAERQGVYEGSPYHNVNFHCTIPFSDDSGKSSGLQVKHVKVKYDILCETQGGKRLAEKDLFAFIGKDVTFFYNEYKNVIFVQIAGGGG
jgi:hypothetical protein